MELDKAQAFIQDLYDTHAPVKRMRRDGVSWFWSVCTGNHYVDGSDGDVYGDKGYCFLYIKAAEILGLPLAPLVVSPPSEVVPTPAEEALAKVYENYIKQSLTSFVVNGPLKSTGEVTFQIVEG